mmetsp:Transcript_69204/g.162808  ORF Transcript_69204/g.162808 Transcript_69204/m.162808 type:complete len:282 (+) Transcript_69204:2-847(+)
MRLELKRVPWLDADTRDTAIAKLDDMFFEVGHPAVWRPTDAHIGNRLAANILSATQDMTGSTLALLNHEPDRRRWTRVTVTDITILYDRQLNTLFIPAGILQRPFYHPSFPVERNLGSLGVIIAHEMIHAFDQGGREFNVRRVHQNWWPINVQESFAQGGRCLADVYSKYETPEGSVDGNRTLSENIADVGGVKVAYLALLSGGHVSVRQRGHVQLFYIAYAQTWCSIAKRKMRTFKLHWDQHAPDRFRVNGPLQQLPQFSTAFACPAGTSMNPFPKCNIW